MNIDEMFMREALKEAHQAYINDEVPIGCVIVKNQQVIARAHNLRESNQKSTSHAEILAIERANEAIGSWRLENCILYVTLEPCPMCAGAILLSRIERVVYGALDPKGGCMESCMKMYEIPGWNHYPKVSGGILENECSLLLKEFFSKKRKQKRQQQQEDR